MSEYSCISLDALSTQVNTPDNADQWRLLAVSPEGVTYLVNATAVVPVNSIANCHLTDGSVTECKIGDNAILDKHINAGAKIAQSKLNIPNASTTAAGYMSKEDKTKLNGIAESATACTGTVTSILFQCASTDKCTVKDSGTINLSANAWNTNATISTTTYPGACCTGTITSVSGCTVSKAATLTCNYICFGSNCIWIG